MSNSNGTKSAAALVAELRRSRTLALRLGGASYRAIGRALGVSHEQARQDIAKVLDEEVSLRADARERLRKVELLRLEKLHGVLWPRALDDDRGAIDRLLRLAERRARLLGLDAPAAQVIAEVPAAELEIDVAALAGKSFAERRRLWDVAVAGRLNP